MGSRAWGGIAGVFLALVLSPCGASAQVKQFEGRQLIELPDGQDATVFGTTYKASGPTVAIAVTSSELITIAVVIGALAQNKAVAREGEALVSRIDGGTPQRFGFDAARLAATLPPDWTRVATEPLREIAARQKRARFWGRIEPVNLNASAPVPPQVEAVRQTYLGNDTIVALRRAAGGKPQVLAGLTVKRFAEALAAGKAGVVADLIDPKPFTDTGAEALAWRAARLTFARRLTGDAALVQAMATPPVGEAADATSFDVAGAYRIHLTLRDRAMFVTAVEPLS
jgi:hypothetical protein